MEVERLEVKNIIEIDAIRKILKARKGAETQPRLLEVFDYVCKCANKQLNDEARKNTISPPLEPELRLELESDSDSSG